MSGVGFKYLLKKAKKGKHVLFATSPSHTINLDEEETPSNADKGTCSSQRKRKHSTITSEVENDQLPPPPPKRNAQVQKRSSSSLNLDDLNEADFARFRDDPLLFMSDVAKAASSKLARYKEEEAGRRAGMRLVHHNLWLEGDLIDKTDKYNCALGPITELREELEVTKKKHEEAENTLQPTNDALATANTERDAVVTAKADAKTKLSAETTRVNELSSKVQGLEEDVAGLKQDLSNTEAARDKALVDLDALEQATLAIAKERFEEAVAQIQYYFPTLEISRQIVDNDHFLKDGQIIQPEEEDEEGNVVKEETVVYRRPE